MGFDGASERRRFWLKGKEESMCGKDCDICGRHNATLHIMSEVDREYDKSLCFECWEKISKKERIEKKLKERVVMY